MKGGGDEFIRARKLVTRIYPKILSIQLSGNDKVRFYSKRRYSFYELWPIMATMAIVDTGRKDTGKSYA